jgi:hypothetical protein
MDTTPSQPPTRLGTAFTRSLVGNIYEGKKTRLLYLVLGLEQMKHTGKRLYIRVLVMNNNTQAILTWKGIDNWLGTFERVT